MKKDEKENGLELAPEVGEKNYDLSGIGDAGALEAPEEEPESESEAGAESGKSESGAESDSLKSSKEGEKDEDETGKKAAKQADKAEVEDEAESEEDAPVEPEPLAARLIMAAAKILLGEAIEEDYLQLAEVVAAREAVDKAFAEGELKGRNAIIEEQLVELPAAPAVPDLGGSPLISSGRPAASIFDMARMAM